MRTEESVRSMRLSEMVASDGPPIALMSSSHTNVSPHMHDFYELVYVRESFCLHELDERLTLIAEGDVFLIAPGQKHRYIGNRVVSIYNCLFSPSQLAESVGEEAFPFARAQMHLDMNERKLVSRLLERMREEYEGRELLWHRRLPALLTLLLTECARMYAKRGAPGAENYYPMHIVAALGEIEAGYAHPLTVAQVASRARVTPDYLAKQFHKIVGVSPLEYIRRYRVARAMELLSAGASVAEAAAKVGYLNPSHFSREFKKEAGVTPTQYRRT